MTAVIEIHASFPTAEQPADGHWLEDWFRSADEAVSLAPAGPSARELHMQDRNRLEKS
ncbi:hypothetical protein [Prosthecobacter vanneervenii]|uniref:Uncharacterized protein n=1 Tax=Prosthecobacter vanneervenii TaxID=48466 RepID=A0A7W7YAF8_9BACT|nr:hypothetical protein [Prosthecobacter vanneervenii]MBB5032579.1 hypothetical protein [Prosthecobacter vanneervenii]